MIIENPEALKSWLTAVLAPLCDADPAALAKYVLALAKKEKPELELQQAMCDQLDVFLQQETKSFVDQLFSTLESKSYLQSNPEPPARSEGADYNSDIKNGATAVSPVVPAQAVTTALLTSESRTRRGERSRDRRRSYSPRSRSRSRSRDRDRSRRSRSRDRTRDRSGRTGYDDRRTRRSPQRRSDRRRSRSPRRSSRSPRRRQRSPPAVSTSHESVPPPASVISSEPVVSTVAATSNTVPIQSVVVAPSAILERQKFRCRDYDEKGFCMRGDLCPNDHGADPVVLEDVELSSMLSYNRPPPPVGAPMRSAPLGPPPVGPLPHLRGPPPSLHSHGEGYNPDAPGISWPPPLLGGPGLVGLRPLGPPPPFGHATHRLPPPHSRMRGVLPPHGPPLIGLTGPQPRELINVTTGEERPEGVLKRTVRDASIDVEVQHIRKKGHFDYNRLGGPPSQQDGSLSHGHHQNNQRRFDPDNCCLEVKKIPRGLNNISMLNNHFSKFGKIVNLQVCFNGDLEGALVTFSSHAEAQAAYRNTEAVLNNRFIKVFWHNKESTSPEMKCKQENVPPNAKAPVKERLGGHPTRVLIQSQTAAPIVEETALKEANEAKEKEREKALAAIKRSQEMLATKEALKKKKEEQKREAAKLQVDLQRRKQELLDKQLQQQRVLIQRLEKNKSLMKQEERASVMQTIRNLQETIEKLKKDLQLTALKEVSSPVLAGDIASTAPVRTPEEARKEMLDVEIELYQKQMEGSDVTELQRRVIELNSIISQAHRGYPSLLRRGARTARTSSIRARGRGLAARGAGRGRGRGRLFYVGPHVSVDRRPTQLKICGFEAQQQGDVLAHFANFGDVLDYQVDESNMALLIRYKSRKDAEIAFLQGHTFSVASLSVDWYLPTSASQKVTATISSDDDETNATRNEGVGSVEEEGREENEVLDDLLNYEEDDEDEERSWRR